MARYSYDRGSRFISIGAAIPAGTADVNTNTTPKNNGAAASTGPGDELGLPPWYSGTPPYHVTWDVRTRGAGGAAFSARVVNLEASTNGSDWDVIDTNNDVTASGTGSSGTSRTVTILSYKFFRANIPNAPVVGSGVPSTEVGIQF